MTRSYVPADAPALIAYICPRDCGRAIEWYTRVFGAVEEGERYIDPEGRVGHATLRIDGATIMLSDAYPDYGAIAPEPGNKAATFALNLYVPDVDAVMKAAEEAGATIQRPAADQFHGARLAAGPKRSQALKLACDAREHLLPGGAKLGVAEPKKEHGNQHVAVHRAIAQIAVVLPWLGAAVGEACNTNGPMLSPQKLPRSDASDHIGARFKTRYLYESHPGISLQPLALRSRV